jgi:hypothetical protein
MTESDIKFSENLLSQIEEKYNISIVWKRREIKRERNVSGGTHKKISLQKR